MEAEKNYVIAINRDIASGGNIIAETLAQRLGIKFINKEKLDMLNERFGIDKEQIIEQKQKKSNLWQDMVNYYNIALGAYSSEFKTRTHLETVNAIALLEAEKDLLHEFQMHEPFIAVGRATYSFFDDPKKVLRVFLYCDIDIRADNYARKYNISHDEAIKELKKADAARTEYVKTYFNIDRYDFRNYDLVLNISDADVKHAVEEIMRKL